MTITICGSMAFIDQMERIEKALTERGHIAHTPVRLDDGSTGPEAKRKFGLIREHMDRIEKSDAVLVMNLAKKGINGYVGANSFLEIGYAHGRRKTIFLWSPLPDQPYIRDELEAMEPRVVNGDVNKIDD